MFCFNNNHPTLVSHDIIPCLKAFLALLLITLAPQGFCVLHQTHLSRQMLIGCSLFERKRRCFWLLDPLREWVFPGYFSSLYILPHSPAGLDTRTDTAHCGTEIIRDKTLSQCASKLSLPHGNHLPWPIWQTLTEIAQFKKTFTDTF